ncbi:MAG: N-acetyltransferase family protein [Phycisphaerales bacterium]
MAVRPLTPADAAAYVALRREMLDDAPWAFAASPGDDAALDAPGVAARLGDPGGRYAIIGGWVEGRLGGAAGIIRSDHVKMAHRAHIWGVYVTPAARGSGLGARIMRGVFDHARSWAGVTSVGLSVSVRSLGAIRLYERMGFARWGLEPGALVLDGRAHDEVHMVASLDNAR